MDGKFTEKRRVCGRCAGNLQKTRGLGVRPIAVIFGFIGALGLVGYTWQAWHYGIWTTVEELSDAERRVSPTLDRILEFLFTYLP